MQSDRLFPEECVLFMEGNEGDSKQSYSSHDEWGKRRRAGWRKRQRNEPRNRHQNAAKEEILKSGECGSIDPSCLKMARRLDADIKPTKTVKVVVKIKKGNETKLKIKTKEVESPKKGTGRRLRESRESIRQAED